MKEFTLHVLAADRVFYNGPCVSISAPASDGEFGVLANHENTIIAIIPGIIRFRTPEGNEYKAVVSQGMMKIENNDVLVLVHSCERPEDIDRVRAERALEEAMRQLKQKQSKREYHMAQANLARALSRLKNHKKP